MKMNKNSLETKSFFAVLISSALFVLSVHAEDGGKKIQTSTQAGAVQYDLGRQDARPILDAIRRFSTVQRFPQADSSVRRLTTYIQSGQALVIQCEDVLVDEMETPIVSCRIEIYTNKKVRGLEFIEGRFGESYLLTLSEASLTKAFVDDFTNTPYESTTRVFFRDPNRGGALVSFPVLAIECVPGSVACWLALVKE